MGTAEHLAGDILDDAYRIERLIGEGGMGAVYEVTRLRDGRRLAAKLLLPGAEVSAETRARFRREAEITSPLLHPNIVEVLELNETPDGRLYIIMELLEGEDLETRRQRLGRFPLAEVVSIFDQVGSALEEAHRWGIVHRDLKPQNIFLCRRDGQDDLVKLLDLGVSKVQGARTALTQTQALIGTPSYMSPEQADERAAEVDLRADVYAMGTVLFELLAGRPPFVASSLPALLYKIVHEPPPSLCALVPEVPVATEEVIARALSKHPNDRYCSMKEFWQAFVAASSPRATGPLVPQGTEIPTNERTVPRAWVADLRALALAEENRDARGAEEPGPTPTVMPDQPPGVESPLAEPGPTALASVAAAPLGSDTTLSTGKGELHVRSGQTATHGRLYWMSGAFLLLAAAGGSLAVLWPARDHRPGPIVARGPRVDAAAPRDVSVPATTRAVATLPLDAAPPPQLDAAAASNLPDAAAPKRLHRPLRPRPARRQPIPQQPAAELTASLSVQARSDDDFVMAEVFVDHVSRGQTPLHLEGLTPGRHEISVKRDGYAPASKRVSLRPGKESRLVLRMSKR